VPGSVDQYLPVPDCTLQKSLETHFEAFLLSVGTGINTASSCDRPTSFVLELVAGSASISLA